MSKPIIVAVDETQLDSFKQIVDSLDSNLCMIKVGSVSFNAIGHEAIQYVASKGFEIFLDLKLHDIPNTVCLLYTSPSPRDRQKSRMPSSA